MPTALLSPEQQLRFMQSVLSESDDCVKIIGLDGTLLFMSEGGKRVMEVDDFEAIRGCPWPDFWDGQGNFDAVAAIETARSGNTARFEGSAKTAKGNPRVWDVKVSPILGLDGKVESILSVSRDITAAKNAAAHEALIRNELSHRIKNIIALVQAIVNQTLRDDDDMLIAKAALLDRLSALGIAHSQLTHKSSATTTLRAIVEATVAQNAPGRIVVKGPDVELSARSALALSLTFHELQTNAVKYGSLSNPDGRVHLTWGVNGSEQQTLLLEWREVGGPPVAPPSRRGFGSRMMEKAMAGYVNGAATADYRPEGLIYSLTANLHALTED